MRYALQRCLFALIVVGAVAPAARAEPGAVLVGGTAHPQQRLVASGAVSTTVRAAGWVVGAKPYSVADSTAAAECLRKANPWACISTILRDKQIQRVAVVSVDPRPGKHGSTDTVITERLVIANLDSLFVAQRFCDYCTDDKLAGLAAEVTKELIDRAAIGSGRTALAVKSVPRGARAYLDANLVGVTDTTINIVPGAHTITVEFDDHRADTRHVVVEEDTTQEVTFNLQRTTGVHGGPGAGASGGPPSGTTPREGRPLARARRGRLVPLAITGAGVAALVTGAVLFALDEDPVTRPGVEVPPRYRDSGTRGVVIGVSGVAVAGLGGYLWWRASRSSSTLPAPVLAPVTGGAVLGVSRSF
jgi:PEGA domain